MLKNQLNSAPAENREELVELESIKNADPLAKREAYKV